MTSQNEIIEFIKKREEVTMKEILTHFKCEKSNLYRRIKKLRKYHLIEFKIDGTDKVIMISKE